MDTINEKDTQIRKELQGIQKGQLTKLTKANEVTTVRKGKEDMSLDDDLSKVVLGGMGLILVVFIICLIS